MWSPGGSVLDLVYVLCCCDYAKTQQIEIGAATRADDQEISMLALYLLQISLVYINTLMIQQVLAEPAWAGRLNTQDLRGITPLIYSHVNPYGSFLLDLHCRLPIDPPRFGPKSVGTQMLLGYDQLTG
jgi:hypothetical protein